MKQTSGGYHKLLKSLDTLIIRCSSKQKHFLFWNFKNHSFIGMLRNLVTFMALGMWTHKRSWSKQA